MFMWKQELRLSTWLKNIRIFRVWNKNKLSSLCTPFWVSRVVWGRPYPLTLHHWPSDYGSTSRDAFPCTHPLTSSTRLDRSQVPFFNSLVWPKTGTGPSSGFRNRRANKHNEGHILIQSWMQAVTGWKTWNGGHRFQKGATAPPLVTVPDWD